MAWVPMHDYALPELKVFVVCADNFMIARCMFSTGGAVPDEQYGARQLQGIFYWMRGRRDAGDAVRGSPERGPN